MKSSAIVATLLLFGLPMLASGQAVDKPTWSTGDTWTIQQGKNTTVYTVLGPTADGYSVRVKEGSGTSILHYDQNLAQPTAHFLWLQWPLESGKQWSHKAPFQGRTYTITHHVVGPDTVSTSAGSFEAIHIKGEHCAPNGRCGTFEMWYAPKVKFYVKVLFSPGYWFDHNPEELTAYDVH